MNKAVTRYNSPRFPHVTLFSLSNTEKTEQEIVEVSRTVISGVEAPISLEIAGVQTGSMFYQGVYLTFEPADELTALCENLLKALDAPANTKNLAPPRASLYYGEGTANDKRRIAMQMMDAGVHTGNLELTEVWIVKTTAERQGDWKILHRQALAGAELAPPRALSPLSLTKYSRRDDAVNALSTQGGLTMPAPPPAISEEDSMKGSVTALRKSRTTSQGTYVPGGK